MALDVLDVFDVLEVLERNTQHATPPADRDECEVAEDDFLVDVAQWQSRWLWSS